MSTECNASLDAYPQDENVCVEDDCTRYVIVNFVVPDCSKKADVYFDLKVAIINIDTGIERFGEKDGLLEHIDGGAGNVQVALISKKVKN